MKLRQVVLPEQLQQNQQANEGVVNQGQFFFKYTLTVQMLVWVTTPAGAFTNTVAEKGLVLDQMYLIK